jgi:glycosyltransferase involved in cell wall biosynthesis
VNRYYSAEAIDLAMRKNLLLLLWKNMTDARLLLNHCLFLPLHLSAHRAYIPPERRVSPRIFFKALKQLPVVLIRRLKTGAGKRRTDREVFKAMSHPLFARELESRGKDRAAKERLNILIVSPYSVYPTKHGGAVRMYNIIRHLSKIHNIFLLGFVDTPDQLEGLRELEKYCQLVKFTVRSPDDENGNPFLLYPPVAYHFLSIKMKEEILDCAAACDIDIIQLEYTQLAFLDIETRTIPTILVEHDISFRSLWRKKRQGMQSILLEERESFRFVNWLKLVFNELHFCRKADQVHTMSEIDRAYLQKMLPRHAEQIIAIPNGVDTAYYEMKRKPASERNLLFVGNFRHTPNIEGIMYFLKDIWPLMKQRIPDVKLYIIGQKPPEMLRELEKSEPIVVTDFVEDLREYYNRCAVFIAPIRVGSGTRLKILEAMAAGIPVVSTTVGAEGIKGVDGRHIFIADTPEAFTAKTYELITNAEKREKIVSSARKLVEDTYDWRIIVKKLDASYRLALEQKSIKGRAD